MSFDIDDDNSDDYELPPYGQFAKPAEAPDDFKVVMGRPVVPNEMEIAIGVKTGIDLSDPYDDSIKKNCKKCLREVWIGPRQQEAMSQDELMVPMCPTCAVGTMQELGFSMNEVHNLGSVHPRGN